MEQQFIEKLKEVIEIEDHEVALEDEFRNYDEWDSLTYLSVIAMLDEEYGVEIETEDFKKLRTVGALWEEVKRRSA